MERSFKKEIEMLKLKKGEVFEGEGWQDIWSRHPDANGYLQMEARFAEGV